jgi:hypothetical protein
MSATQRTLVAPTLSSVALVDLLNVNPAAKTDHDYEDLMDLVGDLIRRTLAPDTPTGQVHEVDCRLYAGFTDRHGGATEQYTRTLRQLRRLTGLQDRVRIVPRIARALACFPYTNLRGTYKNGAQKMVDQMLGHDALFYARLGTYDSMLIIANDDDYVPALLTVATQTRKAVKWLRKRSVAENDRLFSGLPLVFLNDGAWQ